jgi:hypothetical protein
MKNLARPHVVLVTLVVLGLLLIVLLWSLPLG